MNTETQHTPEPWKIDMENFIIGADQETICQFFYKDESEMKNKEANQPRIVACVNSCKNVKKEWLESNSVAALIEENVHLRGELAHEKEQLQMFKESYEEACHERDELKAYREEMANSSLSAEVIKRQEAERAHEVQVNELVKQVQELKEERDDYKEQVNAGLKLLDWISDTIFLNSGINDPIWIEEIRAKIKNI